MTCADITYADVHTEAMIEDWGNEKGFHAAEQIALHVEDRFSVSKIHVASATDEGGVLILRISTDRWTDTREFALLDNGSLAW